MQVQKKEKEEEEEEEAKKEQQDPGLPRSDHPNLNKQASGVLFHALTRGPQQRAQSTD